MIQTATFQLKDSVNLDEIRSKNTLNPSTKRHLEDIARFAAQFYGVPFASLCLFQDDHIWYEANFGFTERTTSVCETLGSEVVDKRGAVEIEKISDKKEFSHLSFIKRYGIDYYAGVPLFGVEGTIIGTLSIMDTKSKLSTKKRIENLEVLAEQAVEQLIIPAACEGLDKSPELATRLQTEKLNQSLKYVRKNAQIELTSLASFRSLIPQSFVSEKPVDIVSGDFYFAKQSRNRLYVALGDCTGHGISAAYIGLVGHEILENIIQEEPEATAAEIVTKLNSELIQNLGAEGQKVVDGMDLGLLIFEPNNKTVQFCGARLNLYVAHSNRKIFRIKGDRDTIGGVVSKQKNFSTVQFGYHPDDTFYLFSDGIKDQVLPRTKERLTTIGVHKILGKLQNQPLDIQGIYFNDLTEGVGYDVQQIDDITVLGFHPSFTIA